MADPVAELRTAVEAAARSLLDGGESGNSRPTLERPPKPEFGDYSTNAAMLLAPALGEQPRGTAEKLAEELGKSLEGTVERVEVAGPGFLNLFLADAWYRRAAAELAEQGDRLGRPAGADEVTERVNVEFVSANPTGPVTAASGRHAAYGDSVARLLEFTGHPVVREYYKNDRGGQIDLFAQSIAARMEGEPVPEGGYEGDYVADLAVRLEQEGLLADDLDSLARRGMALMVEQIEETLHRYNVVYDTWSSERELHESGAVERALSDLRSGGHIYESEGATWLRTTSFGDDKDRVLIRSDGDTTYFLSDIAYHRDKLERGADRLINVLGADHHGYPPRLRAALAALGYDPGVLETPIMQLVHVVEGGERAQMSKRRGEFVTLDELIDDIGADAARFFMLQRSHDTPVDLDLELARKTSNENPVYYVQYAHARIASILRKAGEDAVGRATTADFSASAAPIEPSERGLIKRLCELPDEVAEAAERRAPHRLCAYGMEAARDFHAFYRDCQVVGAEGEGVEEARLGLCLLTKRTIARTLGLLGISAPERM
ncbi:MAG TPA: arginine--tRNA ligase [Solirubrobacterales bacterium]|nr:arginine--tRNA ligase [Solirubrobacterales bacterium]